MALDLQTLFQTGNVNMIKRLCTLLLSVAVISMFTATPLALHAQGDSKVLKYDEGVSGEITSSKRSVSFTLAGKAGEFALIELYGQAVDGLCCGQLTVTNANGEVIADLSQILGIEFPDDGEYTVKVSVPDFDTSSVGTFEVYAIRATLLEVDGKTAVGNVEAATVADVERFTNAYVLDSRDDVLLNFEITNGKYTPFVVIHSVEPGQNLFARAVMGGAFVTGGSLTLQGSRDLRFITVGPFSIGSTGSDNSATVAEYTFSVSKANK